MLIITSSPKSIYRVQYFPFSIYRQIQINLPKQASCQLSLTEQAEEMSKRCK